MESSTNKPLIPHRIRLYIMAFVFFAFFAGLLMFGIIPRIYAHKEVMADSKPVLPLVYTVMPNLNHKTPALELPGEVHPFLTTSIYSRVSGTLKARYVDIGSHVSAGQLLAVVDVPEQDQELEQAKASLAQSRQILNQTKFNYDYAAKSFQRWKSTGKGGGLSQQDIDQRQNDFNTTGAAYQSALAAVKNNEANVKRLMALESYKQITAPFSGIISQRNVDPGANIVAGGSSTSTNLFTIEQIDRLRIYIEVPQTFVPCIRKGMPANITIQEYPRKVFKGAVYSYASMLDQAARTMLTQIILPNPGGKLYPGLYTTVSISMNKQTSVMTVPDNTIISTTKGLQVISVTPDKHLRYIPIKPGRNYGTEVEVLSGLTGNEVLVTNPTDSLKDGQKVRVSVAKGIESESDKPGKKG